MKLLRSIGPAPFLAALFLTLIDASSFWWPPPAINPPHIGAPIFALGEGTLTVGNPVTGQVVHYLYPLSITNAEQACAHIPEGVGARDTRQACLAFDIGRPTLPTSVLPSIPVKAYRSSH